MTVADLDKYVHRDPQLPILMNRMREHGKTFLLTNSGYNYTHKVMSFLLNDSETPRRDWTTYFDYIVVDAKKPVFFMEGSILRQIDRVCNQFGHFKLWVHFL
jgi:5'-nucleotidase